MNGVAWSPDGSYLACASQLLTGTESATTTPLLVYQRTGTGASSAIAKLTIPALGWTRYAWDVAWSPDGTLLAVTHSGGTGRFLTVYQRSGSTFTKIADPATLPPIGTQNVSFSPNGSFMTVTTPDSPYVYIYSVSGTTLTKLANPAVLPTSNGRAVAWSPNSDYLAVTLLNSPYIALYQRSGNTFTKQSGPSTTPTGDTHGASWASDMLATAHAGSPYVTVYQDQDATAPTSPGQPSLSNQAETSVTLTWTAATDAVGVTNYKVYKDGTVYATLGNVLTANVTGLTPGTQYSFTVTALDAAGNESSPSTARLYTPADVTAPNTPTNLQVTSFSTISVSLSWSASTDNIGTTEYDVRRDGSVIGFTTTTAYTDSDLQENTSYTYDVRARDAANNASAYSSSVQQTTAASVPPVPTGLAVSQVASPHSLSVSWNASSGATQYRVKRGTTVVATQSVLSFSDSGLDPSTSYTYYVAARIGTGTWSDDSAGVSATTSSGIDTIGRAPLDDMSLDRSHQSNEIRSRRSDGDQLKKRPDQH